MSVLLERVNGSYSYVVLDVVPVVAGRSHKDIGYGRSCVSRGPGRLHGPSHLVETGDAL